jgi:hypothetical protein
MAELGGHALLPHVDGVAAGAFCACCLRRLSATSGGM